MQLPVPDLGHRRRKSADVGHVVLQGSGREPDGGARLQGADAQAPRGQTHPIGAFSDTFSDPASSPRVVRASVAGPSCRSLWLSVVSNDQVRGPLDAVPRPCGNGEDQGAGVIDDRMRGPGHGTTTVWVYDERRRVRDDVAARLVALPFVGRVEVVGDPASLLSRLAPRQPDVLLVGTQRAVDSGLTAATQVLRAHPGLPVLVLGAPDDAETVRAAVAFGARGYLRWDATAIEMGLGLSRVGLRADGRIPVHQGAPSGFPQPVGAGAWNGAAPLNGSAPTTVRSTVREATG